MPNSNFGFSTTAEEVTTAYSSRISGAIIIVTGVSPNGLGIYTAKALAVHSPSLLILAGRSSSTLSAAEAEIKAISPTCPIRLLRLDLGSIQTVRAAADEVNSWADVPKIDILINNAGIMSCPFQLSDDGIESQFATNHIGPWLFTNLLMNKIVEAKGRIVVLSSVGHMYGPVRFEDYNFKVRSCERERMKGMLIENRKGRIIIPTPLMGNQRRQISLLQWRLRTN